MLSIVSLVETRRYIRRAHARMMVVFFAILYALGSMVLGGMLLLTRVRGGYTSEIMWGSALGTGQWNYPGILIVAPWGVVTLPFLATISMIVVSIGVGIGVSVAILISARLIQDRRRATATPGVVGSVAGLTPAMIALVTLGACCSTTAAATAGVGLVAQASGSNLNSLLVNNWYLDLFQMTVIFVALLAQEMLLEVYGGLFGLEPRGDSNAMAPPLASPGAARRIAGGALRATLLLGGVTWSLAMFAEWTTVSPATASAGLWFQWIFQHQLLGGFAIVAALFPSTVISVVTRRATTTAGYAFRTALLLSGLSLAAWVPPAVAASGAPGFVNELLGAGGFSAAWGAVAPVYSPGVALFLRWGSQYVLLGGFAVAVALAPRVALSPLAWTLGLPRRASSAGVNPAPAPRSTPFDTPGADLSFESRASRLDVPAPARAGVVREP